MRSVPPDARLVPPRGARGCGGRLGPEGDVAHLVAEDEGAEREEVPVLGHGLVPLHPVTHTVVTESTPGQ